MAKRGSKRKGEDSKSFEELALERFKLSIQKQGTAKKGQTPQQAALQEKVDKLARDNKALKDVVVTSANYADIKKILDERALVVVEREMPGEEKPDIDLVPKLEYTPGKGRVKGEFMTQAIAGQSILEVVRGKKGDEKGTKGFVKEGANVSLSDLGKMPVQGQPKQEEGRRAAVGIKIKPAGLVTMLGKAKAPAPAVNDPAQLEQLSQYLTDLQKGGQEITDKVKKDLIAKGWGAGVVEEAFAKVRDSVFKNYREQLFNYIYSAFVAEGVIPEQKEQEAKTRLGENGYKEVYDQALNAYNLQVVPMEKLRIMQRFDENDYKSILIWLEYIRDKKREGKKERALEFLLGELLLKEELSDPAAWVKKLLDYTNLLHKNFLPGNEGDWYNFARSLRNQGEKEDFIKFLLTGYGATEEQVNQILLFVDRAKELSSGALEVIAKHPDERAAEKLKEGAKEVLAGDPDLPEYLAAITPENVPKIKIGMDRYFRFIQNRTGKEVPETVEAQAEALKFVLSNIVDLDKFTGGGKESDDNLERLLGTFDSHVATPEEMEDLSSALSPKDPMFDTDKREAALSHEVDFSQYIVGFNLDPEDPAIQKYRQFLMEMAQEKPLEYMKKLLERVLRGQDPSNPRVQKKVEVLVQLDALSQQNTPRAKAELIRLYAAHQKLIDIEGKYKSKVDEIKRDLGLK